MLARRVECGSSRAALADGTVRKGRFRRSVFEVVLLHARVYQQRLNPGGGDGFSFCGLLQFLRLCSWVRSCNIKMPHRKNW